MVFLGKIIAPVSILSQIRGSNGLASHRTDSCLQKTKYKVSIIFPRTLELILSLGQKCKFSSSLTLLVSISPVTLFQPSSSYSLFMTKTPKVFWCFLQRVAFFYRRHKLIRVWIFRHLMQVVVDLQTGSKSSSTDLRKKKLLDAKDPLSDTVKHGRMTQIQITIAIYINYSFTCIYLGLITT